jgi:hypothetical protein
MLLFSTLGLVAGSEAGDVGEVGRAWGSVFAAVAPTGGLTGRSVGFVVG